MRPLTLVFMLLATGSAMAQNRIDSRQLDCQSIQSLIAQRGAVVLTTGQHTYDRYVADRRFCFRPDVPQLTTIRTANAEQCPVYRCGQPLGPFSDWRD